MGKEWFAVLHSPQTHIHMLPGVCTRNPLGMILVTMRGENKGGGDVLYYMQ